MTPQEIVQSLQALAVQAKEDRIKAQEDRILRQATMKKLEQDLGMR